MNKLEILDLGELSHGHKFLSDFATMKNDKGGEIENTC